MKLFRKKPEDWKTNIDDPEDKMILLDLLNSTKRHRYAYMNAEDVKIAQLWTALIELKKEISKTNELLGQLKNPWNAIVQVGDNEKKKTIKSLVEEIIKPVDQTTQEATNKLVESLMNF